MEPIIGRAISELLERGVSVTEIADALGVTNPQVRLADIDSEHGLLQEVPREWYRILAQLAWERGGLEHLVHELESV